MALRWLLAPALAVLTLYTPASAREVKIPGCYEGPCIAIGESQTFGIMTVSPLEVLVDRRCLIEADCIDMDELRIRAQLEIGHEVIEVELEAWKPFRIHRGTLMLAEVAPDASSQWLDLKQTDYRFRFTFVPDIAEYSQPSSAATPGSSRPSIHSRKAPPAVEI